MRGKKLARHGRRERGMVLDVKNVHQKVLSFDTDHTVRQSTVQTAKTLHADKNMPVADICRTLRISRPTQYRYLVLGEPPHASGEVIGLLENLEFAPVNER